MNITCQRCETTFALPDDMYRPGRKVRCTVCKNVFSLLEKEVDEVAGASQEGVSVSQEEASSSSKGKKKFAFLSKIKLPSIKISGAGRVKKLIIIGVALVSVCLITFAGYMAYSYFSSPEEVVEEKLSPEVEEALRIQFERTKNINLIDVRQFVVANEKLKHDILVIQGTAINNFDGPRSFIEVEASLCGENGKVLFAKRQMAGPTLSPLQLQVFGEKEFQDALTKKLTIVMANEDVPPKGGVPFMVIFTRIPKGVETFEVRPYNAITLDDSGSESKDTKK